MISIMIMNHILNINVQAKVQSKPVPHWEERYGELTTSGDRDVITIASFGEAAVRITGAVPHSPHEPTEEDKRRMVDQGLSPVEYTDDISILQARLRLDKRLEVVEMLVSDSGREMSRGHILERLESQFKETEKAGGELELQFVIQLAAGARMGYIDLLRFSRACTVAHRSTWLTANTLIYTTVAVFQPKQTIILLYRSQHHLVLQSHFPPPSCCVLPRSWKEGHRRLVLSRWLHHLQ